LVCALWWIERRFVVRRGESTLHQTAIKHKNAKLDLTVAATIAAQIRTQRDKTIAFVLDLAASSADL